MRKRSQGKANKEKGKRYERELAKKLSKAFGCNVRRVPCSGALDDWKGDLRNLHGPLDRYCIEAKYQKQLSWWKAIEQARSQAGRLEWLLIVSRAFEGADYVVMDLRHFIELLQNQKEQKQ